MNCKYYIISLYEGILFFKLLLIAYEKDLFCDLS